MEVEPSSSSGPEPPSSQQPQPGTDWVDPGSLGPDGCP